MDAGRLRANSHDEIRRVVQNAPADYPRPSRTSRRPAELLRRADGRVEHTLEEVRRAPDVSEDVPVGVFGARERGSVRETLLVVLEPAPARTEP